MTIAEACEAYLRDLEARNIRKSTLQGYRSLFRQLESFAGNTGLASLSEIDGDNLRSWREQWGWAFSTQRRRLSQLKAFFSYAELRGWISGSPLNGIRSPKPEARPTMPLSVGEVQALLDASSGKPKEQAFLLLLRYSGLGIMDAATLERSAVHGDGELILRRSKSGELVAVLLPPKAVAALGAISPRRRHYFWTGNSRPQTAANYWRDRLKLVAAAAGVKGFHPHRLRNTFAVEHLLAGVSMEDVSTLLGHSSIRTTELYYAPWNRARRSRLVALVKEVHQQDPVLLEFTQKKNPARAVDAAPTEASLATRTVPKPTRRYEGSA